MATLDNIDDNLVYYTEQNQIHPENDTLRHEMDKAKIVSIIKNKELHKTFDYIDSTYTVDSSNFKTKIKDSFVLKNDDAYKYLGKHKWGCRFDIVRNQTVYPKEGVDYYYINYVNKTNLELSYNHFIIVVCLDITKEPEDYKKIHGSPEKYYSSKGPNFNFIQYLRTLQKYDFEEMNNIKQKCDENTEIITRLDKSNKNYMSQKMIEQPNFLKYNLYYYQRADINFMLQREKEADTKKFILDDEIIVNWGKKYQCILKREGGNSVSKFIPRRTIHNYEGELNSFYGGCLCNSPGLGKTLEILTLCGLQPSVNLIIVPDHLFEHWIVEFHKHIKDGHINLIVDISESLHIKKDKSTIVLTTYKKLESNKKILSTNFTRLIIDEFHELFDKKDKTFPLINEVKSTYKWAITGTPFINSFMINNILNFIIQNKIQNEKISKYKAYIDVFCEMFRKNTKESVEKELELPKINEKIYVLKLSDTERTMYDSLTTGVDKETLTTRQMAFCINPNMYFNDSGGIIEKYHSVDLMNAKVINMHQADYEKLFKKIVENKINYLKLKKDDSLTNSDIFIIYDNIVYKKINAEKQKDIIIRFYKDKDVVYKGKKVNIDEVEQDLIDKIWSEYIKEKIGRDSHSIDIKYDNDIINNIKKLDTDLENIRHKMVYFEKQIKLINKKTKSIKRKISDIDDEEDYVEIVDKNDEEITCSICLGEIDDDFTMVQCGHAYCTLCLKTILAQNPDHCPQCKFSLKNTILYTPTFKVILNQEMIEMIKKYGTKIAHLINICKKELTGEKIIVYCHSPSLINNMVDILNENKIASVTPLIGVSIMNTIKEFKECKQVLVLSSEFNASGLNIQFATAIILLQPIDGEYARIRQTENQIIGRIHRIGQTKEVNLIRLIIKDSIESEILRQNKIIDFEYSSSNKKTDYPMTEKQTKEIEE
jgi:SNF2 family DNA or RNA helicase